MTTNFTYIAWTPDGDPVTLKDHAAVVRFSQAHCLSVVVAYWLNNQARGLDRIRFVRDRDLWRVLDDEGELTALPADPLSDPRALAIVDYVEAHVWDRADPVRVPKADWNPRPGREVDPTGTTAPFGFLAPAPRDDGSGRWKWAYCPELIAEQTAWLTENQFGDYLSYLDLRVAMCMVEPGLDPVIRERRIESTVYDTGPVLAAVISEVHLRVLDAAANQ